MDDDEHAFRCDPNMECRHIVVMHGSDIARQWRNDVVNWNATSLSVSVRSAHYVHILCMRIGT